MGFSRYVNPTPVPYVLTTKTKTTNPYVSIQITEVEQSQSFLNNPNATRKYKNISTEALSELNSYVSDLHSKQHIQKIPIKSCTTIILNLQSDFVYVDPSDLKSL